MSTTEEEKAFESQILEGENESKHAFHEDNDTLIYMKCFSSWGS